MRVDAFNKLSQLYQVGKPKKVSGTVTESRSDSLEISQMGKDYQVAKNAVQAAPDIRQDKVDAIRQQIAGGTYTAGGSDVAEGLVERYFDQKA